jgi:hypothetical protein
LGHSPDPTAFVIGAFTESSPILYFIHAEKHLQMDVTDVANKIKQLEKTWTFDVKVIDGSAKMAVAELNQRHQVNVFPSDKTHKENFINLMNSDFIQQRIMLLPGAKELGDELSTLVWQSDNGVIKLPRKEHPSLPNHLADGALYNWRHCYNYLQTVLEKKPFIDFNDQDSWERAHREKLIEIVKTEQNPHDWSRAFEPDPSLFNFDLDNEI